MPVERFRAEYGSTELYDEELSGKNSQYNKLHPIRFGKSLECRIGSTEYTGIEQIPELQHDKEGEENSQVVYIHSLRTVVEIINHSEQYDEEDRATPIILDRIALLIIKSVLRRGFSSITVSLGGIEQEPKRQKYP